ncbi:MAG TPA: HEAT repeat domain-containing protein [Urbifossiella sp.]|jgi:HEAT repeat protein|nr:HEAT repeat domain-containing protein [Urbifossiella sp.]
MGKRTRYLLLGVPLLGLLVWFGCGKREKSTPELIADVKSPQEKDRLIAVRLLAQRKGDAAQTVSALTAALKDHEPDIRWSAAIGLGGLGEGAKDAVPALQAALADHDARVREAAGVALARIDPTRFTPPVKTPRKGR